MSKLLGLWKYGLQSESLDASYVVIYQFHWAAVLSVKRIE